MIIIKILHRTFLSYMNKFHWHSTRTHTQTHIHIEIQTSYQSLPKLCKWLNFCS